MSIADFSRCTPEEFEAICKAYHDKEESRQRDDWERMRLLATIVIQPHIKRKITPKKLLPLVWDKVTNSEILSKEESRKRFDKLIERIHAKGRKV